MRAGRSCTSWIPTHKERQERRSWIYKKENTFEFQGRSGHPDIIQSHHQFNHFQSFRFWWNVNPRSFSLSAFCQIFLLPHVSPIPVTVSLCVNHMKTRSQTPVFYIVTKFMMKWLSNTLEGSLIILRIVVHSHLFAGNSAAVVRDSLHGKEVSIVLFNDQKTNWLTWSKKSQAKESDCKTFHHGDRSYKDILSNESAMPITNRRLEVRSAFVFLCMLHQWGLFALRHGIKISMEAILACHPARSTEWLDFHPKSCELWRIRAGPIVAST